MKKKILIIILVLIILILCVFFILRKFNKNFDFYVSMIGVSKDIVIREEDVIHNYGGYAATSCEYYVDIGKKKIYKVKNYYVYGGTKDKNGDHYSLEATKKITDEELNKILDATKLDSNYFEVQFNDSDYLPLTQKYYIINYNNRTIEVTKDSVIDVAKILNSVY